MILQIGKMKNKGFLLLETIVSVAILSIALVLILNSFIQSVKAIELSEDYFKAGLLLENKIFEVHNADLKVGSMNGSFVNFKNRFSWHLDILETEEGSLNEINLEVSWRSQNNKLQNMSMATYVKAQP